MLDIILIFQGLTRFSQNLTGFLMTGIQTTNGKGGVGHVCFGWIKCIGLKARSGFESGMRITRVQTNEEADVNKIIVN